MSAGDQSADDETTEQLVDSTWTPATQPPSVPPTSESPTAWQPPPPRNWTAPSQQGWTPPQQQGWGPPQQDWSPPQQGWAQGYPGQSPYWTAPQYGSSPLAVIAGVLLLVVGVLIALFGLLLLVVGASAPSFIAEFDPIMADQAAAIGVLVLAFGVILLIVGILAIVGAVGIFNHKSWGRWIGIVTASIGMILGLLLLIASVAPPAGSGGDAVFASIWLGGHTFIAAALAVAGEHFQPAYRG